ncbi:Cactin, partial [Phakopsora pachyrhizi]
VREKHAKPIDLLDLNLKWENGDDEDGRIGLEVDLDEPYAIFDNLSLEETQELVEDFKMHISLEKSIAKLKFWCCLQCVCNNALTQL